MATIELEWCNLRMFHTLVYGIEPPSVCPPELVEKVELAQEYFREQGLDPSDQYNVFFALDAVLQVYAKTATQYEEVTAGQRGRISTEVANKTWHWLHLAAHEMFMKLWFLAPQNVLDGAGITVCEELPADLSQLKWRKHQVLAEYIRKFQDIIVASPQFEQALKSAQEDVLATNAGYDLTRRVHIALLVYLDFLEKFFVEFDEAESFFFALIIWQLSEVYISGLSQDQRVELGLL